MEEKQREQQLQQQLQQQQSQQAMDINTAMMLQNQSNGMPQYNPKQYSSNTGIGQQNPFSSPQYSHMGLPDVPISYGGGMVDSLLNDNEVPKEIRQQFWYLFHKDNTLTFLDEARKISKLLNFDIIKIDMLNSMPYYNYTFEKEMEFTVLRNVFETKLDRALGYKGSDMKNERTVLQSQFSEQRQISESGTGGNIREGFFKRLLGRR